MIKTQTMYSFINSGTTEVILRTTDYDDLILALDNEIEGRHFFKGAVIEVIFELDILKCMVDAIEVVILKTSFKMKERRNYNCQTNIYFTELSRTPINPV